MSDPTYENLWQAPKLTARIDADIEQHRKSDATLRIEDSHGKPLPGVNVAVDQVASDFLFGANIFMLGGYPTAELNERYEQAFLNLFNAATVPLYWKDLEPTQGHLRFTPDSEPIPRRPPPDTVVAFCEQHGLNMNGHCLVWDFKHYAVPAWAPEDPARCAPLWEQRIRQIAERYGQRIPRWDVLNEAVIGVGRRERGESIPMLDDHERLAFEWARRRLPDDAFLMINETGRVWRDDLQPYIQLIRRLLDQGAPVHGIGMQFHVFSDKGLQRILAGEVHQPANLLAALDAVAEIGLPIHVSEITLPSLANDQTGREAQARVASNFYRLWFSHPAVHGITWWNVPDGGAAVGEDHIASGLLTSDLRPKPAYLALHELIHRNWRTRLTATTDARGEVRFRGFHGRYRVTFGSATHTIHVRPGDAPVHRLTPDGATIAHE